MTATDSSPAPPSPESVGLPRDADKLDRRVLVVAGVVVLGAIMSILDITVVSVALQTFQQDFDATSAQVAWTMTGYTLALASVIPLTGWAADRFGTKRLYLLAVVLFTLGSVLCATADSLATLVLFRVLQGLGGGMLMPLGMTILTRAAGPDRVGRVMAVLGIPMLLGPIFGPILGGWLIDVASWHWIFLINLPIGIAALIYAALVLPRDDVEPSESLDWVGVLLLSPGLAAFLYGVSTVPEEGTVWSRDVLVPAVVGLALIAAFVPWALRRANEHPLVELRLLSNRSTTVAVVAMALFAMTFFGVSLLFPLYFQQVRGEDALGAGLLLAPQGLGAMITMPLAGFLADKIGAGKVVPPSLVLVTLGMSVYTQVDADTSYAWLLGGLFVMGLGMGGTMMPIMAAALATLADSNIARGSTLMNIVQQTAASAGTALFSVLLTDNVKEQESFLTFSALQQQLASATGDQAAALQAQLAQLVPQAMADLASAYAPVFLAGTVMVSCVLVPALFLPRHKAERSAALIGH